MGNPNHDAAGRFSTASGISRVSLAVVSRVGPTKGIRSAARRVKPLGESKVRPVGPAAKARQEKLLRRLNTGGQIGLAVTSVALAAGAGAIGGAYLGPDQAALARAAGRARAARFQGSSGLGYVKPATRTKGGAYVITRMGTTRRR